MLCGVCEALPQEWIGREIVLWPKIGLKLIGEEILGNFFRCSFGNNYGSSHSHYAVVVAVVVLPIKTEGGREEEPTPALRPSNVPTAGMSSCRVTKKRSRNTRKLLVISRCAMPTCRIEFSVQDVFRDTSADVTILGRAELWFGPTCFSGRWSKFTFPPHFFALSGTSDVSIPGQLSLKRSLNLLGIFFKKARVVSWCTG